MRFQTAATSVKKSRNEIFQIEIESFLLSTLRCFKIRFDYMNILKVTVKKRIFKKIENFCEDFRFASNKNRGCFF